MGNKARKKKSDFPNRQWPLDFPWVRCDQEDCLTGIPEQDKVDMNRHYKDRHPEVAYDPDVLIFCTRREYLDYLNQKAPLSIPGQIRTQAPELPKVRTRVSGTAKTANINRTLQPKQLNTREDNFHQLGGTLSMLPSPQPPPQTGLNVSSPWDMSLPHPRYSHIYPAQPLACLGANTLPLSVQHPGNSAAVSTYPSTIGLSSFTGDLYRSLDLINQLRSSSDLPRPPTTRQHIKPNRTTASADPSLFITPDKMDKATHPLESNSRTSRSMEGQSDCDALGNLRITDGDSGGLDLLPPPIHRIELSNAQAPMAADFRGPSSSISDSHMASELSARKRRGHANHETSGFRGWGCYIPGCNFASTGKNAVSTHLGSTHSLAVDQRRLDKIKWIDNCAEPVDNDTKEAPVCGAHGTRTATKSTVAQPALKVGGVRHTKRRPGQDVKFVDKLPPWNPPQQSTTVNAKPNSQVTSSLSLPASSITQPDRKKLVPKSRAKATFDHTRLPIYYQCYIEGCEVTGRRPDAILSHWKVENAVTEENFGLHVGQVWDMNRVYKVIRVSNKEVEITTHGEDPTLPSPEVLDPKNVKQYYPPLANKNITSILVRSTATSKAPDKNKWWCILCYVPIGTLKVVKEHLADCHGFMKQAHNAQTKKIHYFAAHAEASGRVECHMPDWDRNPCTYAGEGDIMQHLIDEHELSEDDLLENEKTGRIFLTIGEVMD